MTYANVAVRLVSGAGDIKLTKDGLILLNEMQIQDPTAALIARTATAQDDMTGDGTTSVVLLVGELLRQADQYISEGLHQRLIADGFDLARDEAIRVLDTLKQTKDMDRDTLITVTRTSLRTKLSSALTDILTEVLVDAVLAIRQPNEPLDLYMIEIMQMQHKTQAETR